MHKYLTSAFNLTARETSIVAEIANGKSNAEIAGILGISEKTVKNVLMPVCMKMDIERGGSARVRIALKAHRVGPYGG